MAKTTKAERKAFDALDDAAGAAKTAKKVAKGLPGKPAKKLRRIAGEVEDVVDGTKKKAVRKDPAKVRKLAEKAAHRALEATDEALTAADEQARRDAQRAAAKKAGEAPETDAVPARTSDLSALTVASLRALARAEGRTGYWRLTKVELIELLS